MIENTATPAKPSSAAAAAHGSPRPTARDVIRLSLRDHDIGFYLPPGGVLNNTRLDLPHGAVISGLFVGDLVCAAGSLILTREARVCGNIEADRIYIEGDLLSSRERRTVATGRMLIAASSNARINADLRSRNFAMHKPKLWGRLITIEDGPGKIEQ